MQQQIAGILAHVDAGKTTLSEAMLYVSGAVRRLGRVDHQDAFLDTDAIERERGITIFSKQAVLSLPAFQLTLLDTPGHVDFSAEMERTLQVLDYAILVISGTDGVQGHTLTLWQLLKRYEVPVFLFVNKMDLPGADKERLLRELQSRLDDRCVDFTFPEGDAFWEAAATSSEAALSEYLETGRLSDETLQDAVARRQLFPCLFGSALKLEGVAEFLDAFQRFTRQKNYPDAFGARVYKIARDEQGARLTYLKVTGGTLRVKDPVTNRRPGDAGDGSFWTEKADQLRLYSGAKFQILNEVPAGGVCAVTGLSRTYPGQGLGCESGEAHPVLEPVLTYRLLLPDGCDPFRALSQLRQLEEEDPQLHLVWQESTGEIHIQLMGEVQLEVLSRLIRDRFGMEVSFGAGRIVYKETIAEPVEGVGHFEPLRHYAEVHLLLEPGERGSGLTFRTVCPEDQLDRNWQRLILTHLEEKVHRGVLTGAPITDMVITLTAGKAHVKHTEGGDFRQATYRAVRQGLRRAKSILLEPWYSFRLEVPQECVGHAMADLQRLSARFEGPEHCGDHAVLTGSGPAACLRGYGLEVTAYTKGQGRFSCTLSGYAPCHDQDEVVAAIGYDCDGDLANTADSVFCSHGAGTVVKWDEVEQHMHLPAFFSSRPEREEEKTAFRPRTASPAGTLAAEKELREIFERTYGPVKRKDFQPPRPRAEHGGNAQKRPAAVPSGPEYLLVDGYNIIFAWDELKTVARENLDAARQLLMDLLCNYQAIRQCRLILVFDAYKVPNNPGSVETYHNIHVVYTKEAETADHYIEKATYELGQVHRVRVATSDGAEQLIILGHGALRVSARIFHDEVMQTSGELKALLEQNRIKGKHLDKLEHTAAIRPLKKPPTEKP